MKTTEFIYLSIVEKLKNKEPFSMVRIGDGEGMVLNYKKNIKHTNFVFNRQLGYLLSNNEIESICKDLRYTYNNADIIGAPTRRHLKISSSWRKAFKAVNYLKAKNSELCSIDIHTELLVHGFLDTILNFVDKVFIISGRNINKKLMKKYPNIKEIKNFKITPEMKYEANKAQEKHYPDQYKKVKKWISRQDCKGCLCLCGAGVVGKIYNQWFKEQGGIAIDIGSVFDIWAGKVNRGKNRGNDNIEKPYKL